MNIALVSAEIHKHGGVPLCMAYLLEHLRHHHTITVFSNQLADVDTAGLRFYRIPLPSHPNFLRPLLFAIGFNILFIWLRLSRRARFDIVHTEGSNLALLPDEGLTANVVTSHFCQRKELDALRQGLIALPTRTWGQKCRALDYHLNRRLGCFLERLTFGRKSSRLRTVVSHRMKEDFLHYYGSSAEAIVVIPNGVDTEEFHPRLRAECRDKIRQLCGLSGDDFLLFFTGGDWGRKGLSYAIETLNYISDPCVKLLVVGKGDEGHYRHLAKEYGVESRVTFITRFVRQSHYYAASDVFLFPTLYEPFGLVILEAMAAGLPVITSAMAGAADYIENGVEGFLVDDVRDARKLASRVQTLFENEQLRQIIGERARRKAESMPWQSVTASYEAIYQAQARVHHPAATGGDVPGSRPSQGAVRGA